MYTGSCKVSGQQVAIKHIKSPGRCGYNLIQILREIQIMDQL